jgi:ribosome maturation factor RimP
LTDLSGQKFPLLLLIMEVIYLKEVLEEVSVKISDALASDEIVVDSIDYEKKGKYNFLTVTLDKVGGIDLDTIVEATKVVNAIVDDANITDDSYILDVVSKERG